MSQQRYDEIRNRLGDTGNLTANTNYLPKARNANERARHIRTWTVNKIYEELLRRVVTPGIRVRLNILTVPGNSLPTGITNRQSITSAQARQLQDITWIWKAGGDAGGIASRRGRQFTQRAARLLAQNYDKYVWTAYCPNGSITSRYSWDDSIIQRINDICNPTHYTVPPEAEDLTDISNEKLDLIDRALTAINRQLENAHISVQIVPAGHKPKYDRRSGSFTHTQGAQWPQTQHDCFVIMFTGADPTKLHGNDAQTYLRDIGLWSVIEPAWNAAIEVFGENNQLDMVIAFDNGIK